ncbi:ABC transporter ATP-binding protein [Maledivibacter halophilus]|uniref:Peptide/nickel transport system ATP-binding protein n=1 Tax=Maledivibacter halophilus TaxID=36842 RepID=A0A1T5LJ33_9FIRM|nr:dipeptide ABC transporter ATP-binding protein [Maledivibacter halophilus]SKC75884.1 peptide/nickel transport system ATP-binding protein [Maledivibacter halophilus]
MNEPLLEVKNLKKYFPVTGGFFKKTIGYVKAADDISFEIKKRETLGLVGESGCGKSTIGRSILRLHEPTSGEVYYKGKNVIRASKNEMKKLRKEMQIVFQDPYSSLNPRMTVGQIISEPIVQHGIMKNGKKLEERIKELLEKCGLASYHTNRYPHQFSGGQRQRIGIARALTLNPSFIVADEPVSALDVSIQSQVLNLMMDLQEELGLSYLFISHDLSVVRHISNRIGVMYLGSLVELSGKKDLFESPKHPYTKALLSAIPEANPRKRKKQVILKGDIPSNVNPPSGCKFHTRCPYVMDICKEASPEFRELGDKHFVACHMAK